MLNRIFGADGVLPRLEPRFEPRPGQLTMARRVEEALESGRPLAVEAGTGVGKSLAYLVPAALWALEAGKRVAVATYTRALQDQLAEKDLPLAARVLAELGLELKFGLLKGADNYLCLQRLRRAREHGRDLFDEDREAELDRLAEWAQTARTGLRSAIPWEVPEAVWSQVARDTDVCLGRRGPDWPRCLYRKDLERAEAASVLVLNHRLLLSEARLPPFDALIVDEAHHLEDVACRGPEVSQRQVRRFLDDLYNPRTRRGWARGFGGEDWRAELEGLVASCGEGSASFFPELARAAGLPGPGSKRLVSRPAVHDRLSPAALRLADFLKDSASLCRSAEEEGELARFLRRATEIAETSRGLLLAGSSDQAVWVERTERSIALKSAPLDTAPALKALWGRVKGRVVLTSATLAAGESFEPLLKDLALEDAGALKVGSPFDYASRAALFVDREMPDPSLEEAFAAAAVERCLSLLKLVPGGLFILAPSRKLMKALHAGLAGKTGSRSLWVQGEEDSHRLLERFRAAGDGVLVGTDTFWQGVDVPGPALSCVVIARLPFASPESPLDQARMERLEARGQSPFRDYSLPRAVLKFRQGFGRLMRRREDHGVVVVLDPRVARKAYGRLFVKALPECAVLRSIGEIGGFFEGLRDAPEPSKRASPSSVPTPGRGGPSRPPRRGRRTSAGA